MDIKNWEKVILFETGNDKKTNKYTNQIQKVYLGHTLQCNNEKRVDELYSTVFALDIEKRN